MILADTSGLLCLFNVREPQHAAVRDIVAQDVEPPRLSATRQTACGQATYPSCLWTDA